MFRFRSPAHPVARPKARSTSASPGPGSRRENGSLLLSCCSNVFHMVLFGPHRSWPVGWARRASGSLLKMVAGALGCFLRHKPTSWPGKPRRSGAAKNSGSLLMKSRANLGGGATWRRRAWRNNGDVEA